MSSKKRKKKIINPNEQLSICLTQNQSPGDILMLTACVRDFKRAHPEIRVGVRTTCMELWENNPNIDTSVTPENAHFVIAMEYPLIHKSHVVGIPFVYAFHYYLESELFRLMGERKELFYKVVIPKGYAGVDVHLAEHEKANPIRQRYGIIDAGYKSDAPVKGWATAYYQEVVNKTKDKILWVQIGDKPDGDGGAIKHFHPKLEGTVDMRGKTTLRMLMTLMYHAEIVVTPISMPMHLATMPTPSGKIRPAIVIAGGREPSSWVGYSGHQYLHRVGMFKCCDSHACWHSKMEETQCECTVDIGGQTVPMCMASISVNEVVEKVDLILGGFGNGMS